VLDELAAATENRRESLPPKSHLEQGLHPNSVLKSAETTSAAAPSTPLTDTFSDPSQQQCPGTFYTVDWHTQFAPAGARARDRGYRDQKSNAAQCFHTDAHDPMIGGRELNTALSKQNSIDQTLGGGLGGMEDDEDFRKFVARARLTRGRPGTVPRRTADVMDVVRYIDQQ